MLRRSLVFLAATAASAAALVGTASAAERWADPAGAGGLCTALSPCSLSGAVTGAIDGDVVRVKAGTYAVGSMTVAQAIEIRGEDVANPPVLSGTTLGATMVGDGGLRLTNLKITGTSGDALTLKGGARGDRLILHSDTGDGAEVVSDPGTTRLTNSLVTSGGGATTAALRMSDAGLGVGTVEVRNVTAYATGSGGNGARCETLVSTTTIVNSIFRGDGADIDSALAGVRCSAANSNLRPFLSPGGLTVTGLQQSGPALDGDYRPTAASPVVDAGLDHASNGTLDLAGATRVRGLRTDIGAYELQAEAATPPAAAADPLDGLRGVDGGTTRTDATATTATTTPAAPPAADERGSSPLAPAGPPVLGVSILLDQPGQGAVLVRLPGTNRFIPLSDAASIPVGTTIDTRKGSVTLSSALPGGEAQTGTFNGGLFEVRQSKRAGGMTDILLRGDFAKKCAKQKSKRVARAAAKKRKRAVRRLWAKDKGGRFRTHGRNSVATVRGTKWLTEDRCDGTLTKVVEGAVDVRSKRGGKTRRVKSGRSLLVRR